LTSQGRDVGQALVAHGWAVAYRRYSIDYLRDEDLARHLAQGLWAGRFEMPWEWRQARRSRLSNFFYKALADSLTFNFILSLPYS
jgi:endonuclease YncB( thermonuclease family)